ncbi:hypothetical protein [Paenibacillus guangzhouensis]|uniref:hypothetical protein n=1 Tax=Paenibacillus guangzhouensis TaxID=1473112 RepID=UPI00187B1AC2|nr:hypothetical protein [Paenibacillus guangzhouensis]
MQRISLCKEIIDVILEYISSKADVIHLPTAEDIVTTIHTMEQNLDTELLHLQLEMCVLERARRKKGKSTEGIRGLEVTYKP